MRSNDDLNRNRTLVKVRLPEFVRTNGLGEFAEQIVVSSPSALNSGNMITPATMYSSSRNIVLPRFGILNSNIKSSRGSMIGESLGCIHLKG